MVEKDPMDVAIGAEIRRRRKAAGISLEATGKHLGVTYQQVQKYETGANRISASTLIRLGEILPGGHVAIMSAAGEASGTPDTTVEPEDRVALDRLAEQLAGLSAATRRRLIQSFAVIAGAQGVA